jgi:hypothetical protein
LHCLAVHFNCLGFIAFFFLKKKWFRVLSVSRRLLQWCSSKNSNNYRFIRLYQVAEGNNIYIII